MARTAGIEVPVNSCRPSPAQWHYRSKISPHHGKPRKSRSGAIGFLSSTEPSHIVDVIDCPIALPAINAKLPALRADLQARAASIRRGNTLRLRTDGQHTSTDTDTVMHERVGDIDFRFLSGDFFQTNPSVLPEFTRYVASQASSGNARYLVDAYCGCGLFALTLAADFQQVIGVDVSASSIEWARRNAQDNGISNAEFVSASAEAIFAAVEFPAAATTVIIDPPRSGCSQEFIDQLLKFGPANLVYVSCDPATQVRDLKTLVGAGYQVTDVQPFDLFPQTRHLESIMTLRKT